MRVLAAALMFSSVITSSALAVDVSQTFDLSAAPITLYPYDPASGVAFQSNQYVSLNVNFSQSFSSFGNPVLSGTALNSQGMIVGIRWAYSGISSLGGHRLTSTTVLFIPLRAHSSLVRTAVFGSASIISIAAPNWRAAMVQQLLQSKAEISR